MNELIAFWLGLGTGAGIVWYYTREQLKKLELLENQTRILAATIADNFMDLEELRKEIKDIKDWVTGELMAIDRGN